MPIISNTSPLIFFAKVGQTNLLHLLYGDIWVPNAVRDEIAVGAGTDAELQIFDSQRIVVMDAPEDRVRIASRAGLDRGEAEVVALGQAQGSGTLILIDDKIGRRFAGQSGLQTVGTGGALVAAKQAGLIERIRPVFEQMFAEGLYLHETLYHQLLAIAREAQQANDNDWQAI